MVNHSTLQESQVSILQTTQATPLLKNHQTPTTLNWLSISIAIIHLSHVHILDLQLQEEVLLVLDLVHLVIQWALIPETDLALKIQETLYT